MQEFVFIIIIALFIIGFLVRPGGEGIHIFEDKGVRGEREGYFVFNDVMIKRFNGKTSQIDHVVVSKHGVFVMIAGGHVEKSERMRRNLVPTPKLAAKLTQ